MDTRLPAEIWFCSAWACTVVVPVGRLTTTVEPVVCLRPRRALQPAPHPLLVEPLTPAAVLIALVAVVSVVVLHGFKHQLMEMLEVGAPRLVWSTA